ncbi:MAG: hypothetical protein WC544_00635 [Patescibacteria group bacterium]
MRIREEALALYRKYFELIEGSPLPETFVIELSDHERGAPMAYIQQGGMVGAKIEPAHYWQDLPEPAIAGLCAHEMGNYLRWPPPAMQVELGERIAEVDRQYKMPEYTETWQRRINRLRWEYEYIHGLLIITLADKLVIDYEASKLLLNARLPVDCLVQFLEAEHEQEFRQVEPVERKPGRVFVAEVRIAHARLLARGDDETRRTAEDMRRFYERWSRQLQAAYEQHKALSSEQKTPSAS